MLHWMYKALMTILKRDLVNTTRCRQSTFTGHAVRKKIFDRMLTIHKINGKKGTGRSEENIKDIMAENQQLVPMERLK